MHRSGSRLVLSATDLSGFAECEHKTALDVAVTSGQLTRPGQNEIERRMLERRGHEHEARVLERYRAAGFEVTRVTSGPLSTPEAIAAAASATEAAMQSGAAVIHQGVFFDGKWLGRPDFLVRTEGPSRFGAHHYEVVDAKLAEQAKASAVLQLCAYTEQLGRVQERVPEHFWIAVGGEGAAPLPFRSADYLAYFRRRKLSLLQTLEAGAPSEVYPEPVEHCDVCLWWKRCEDKRRSDDHLSLVAGITRRQRDRLGLVGVESVEALAKLGSERAVPGVGREALERVVEQAALQRAGREQSKLIHRLFHEFEPGTGLERLPKPTPGDLFLDLEGDPFVQGGGLEYLFGLLELGEPSDDFMPREAPGAPRYHAYWAANPAEEKRAFEAVIDRIMLGLSEFRGMHVFHFGQRENEALKTLSCRHHTREEQVDQILRGQVLVDLHRVVKQSLRASVEAYTLKELEKLYAFQRRTDRREAARAMQLHGFWLETGERLASDAELQQTIALYNEDDCLSAHRLRDWLEQQRIELSRTLGRALTRPEVVDGSATQKREHENQATAAVAARLREGLPEDPAADAEEERAKRLLSHLLDWHWRESKSGYWEYFRTLELPKEERLGDRAVLSDLRFVEDRGALARSRIHRYAFPEQEHSLKKSDDPLDPDTQKSAGAIVEIGGNYVDLKRNANAPHPSALIRARPPETAHQRERLLEIGRSIAEHGFSSPPDARLARALLLRSIPQVGQAAGAPLMPPGVDTVAALSDLALRLDGAVLAVQGPPGSGKTHRAARLIAALVAAGKRVGVTANSHKVITALLSRAIEAARSTNVTLTAAHNPGSDKAEPVEDLGFELDADHARNRERLQNGEIQLLGGTAWAWSRPEFRESVDVLIVDEAGQLSLANVLAISHAAKNLILLGDPAQLDQPQKGVHPGGADASALEHLLGDALTLPDERGVFLAETRRLPPSIREFTSEVFYQGRLQSIPGLENQRVRGTASLTGSGLRYLPVEHRGNTNQSDEEVEVIGRRIDELLAAGAVYTDAEGKERPLVASDVMVIAPYNAQVAALRRRLPDLKIAIGTVDRFQGAQAPVVFYSLTSSSAEDAPRGMEFLYSLNRLNVATSRAKALVVLVACPALIAARCKTPRQMKLANALAAYIERAALPAG